MPVCLTVRAYRDYKNIKDTLIGDIRSKLSCHSLEIDHVPDTESISILKIRITDLHLFIETKYTTREQKTLNEAAFSKEIFISLIAFHTLH